MDMINRNSIALSLIVHRATYDVINHKRQGDQDLIPETRCRNCLPKKGAIVTTTKWYRVA